MNEADFEVGHLPVLRKAKPEVLTTSRHLQLDQLEGTILEIPYDRDMRDEVSVPYNPLATVSLSAEEVTIVIFVLLLWVGAIALFYHQWGKINGLEPYQPDFVHANLTLHNEIPPLSENNFQTQTQMACSPGTTLDRSYSDLATNSCIRSKGRSESHNDFIKNTGNGFNTGLFERSHQVAMMHRNSQSLEEPMTPSVVISFEAETSHLASQSDFEHKSRPHSLASLSDYPYVPTSSHHHTPTPISSQRHTVMHNRHNWSEQSHDSSCSITSLQRAFEQGSYHKGATGGGLHLPSGRSPHGRSMSSLNRLGHPSHISLIASSMTSCRGLGGHRRHMAAHNRHLAESTLKLWQQKPQNFVFVGGLKGRRKSLSVSSLRCGKGDFV